MELLLKYTFVCFYIFCGVSAVINTTPKDVPITALGDNSERTIDEGSSISTASLRTPDRNGQENTEFLYPLIIRAYHSLKAERKSLYDLIVAFQRENNAGIELMQAVISVINRRNAVTSKQGQTGLSLLDNGVSEENVNSGELRHLRKRSTFDSISHNGGLGRLGHAESGRRGKLAFTFKNLLPYLLGEHRRNNRASVRRRRPQKT